MFWLKTISDLLIPDDQSSPSLTTSPDKKYLNLSAPLTSVSSKAMIVAGKDRKTVNSNAVRMIVWMACKVVERKVVFIVELGLRWLMICIFAKINKMSKKP